MNRSLLVVRPEPENARTCERARLAGLKPISLPLFELVPLEWDLPPDLKFDGLLLTSANAIRFGGSKLDELRHLACWCVGGATAAAARHAGFQIAAIGEAGVASLLVECTSISLLHLCGKSGSEYGDPAAKIRAIPVYDNRIIPSPSELEDVLRDAPMIAVHSARAARRVAALVTSRSNISIVAISSAVAESAGEGWQKVAIAAKPSDDALIAAAKALIEP